MGPLYGGPIKCALCYVLQQYLPHRFGPGYIVQGLIAVHAFDTQYDDAVFIRNDRNYFDMMSDMMQQSGKIQLFLCHR